MKCWNKPTKEGKHTMRKIAALLAPLAIACFIVAGAATASVEECSNGQVFWQGQCQAPDTPITICHVAGLASDPANYITLNITLAAAVGEAGHFGENGTPNAGHEQDTLGACNPPLVDVCPNLEGNQSEVPPGYHLGEDENGRPICVQNEPEDLPLATGVTFTEATCTTAPSFQLTKTNIEGLGLRPFYEVEGPDFVDGHPVAGGTYTFTAIPVEGYVFTGETVFEHTFAPAPTDCGGQHVTVGTATVICDNHIYRLSGTVDGQAADSVNPATLPGDTKGVSNVVVTRGDTSVRTTVTTLGDCATPPPPTTTSTPAPPAVVPPVAPAVKPKPKPVRKPVAKPKPKKKHKVKPKPKHKANKKPHKAPTTLSLR